MAAPRLDLQGEFFRLKPAGKDTFAPDDFADFSKFLNGDAITQSFVFCISVRNVDDTITEKLEKIRQAFNKARIQIILADNGSDDSTVERCEVFFERAGLPFLLYQFEFESSLDKRMSRIFSLAASYRQNQEVIFSEFHEPTPKFKTSSFSVIATREIRVEAAALIRSLRTFHSEPIFVMCDNVTKEFLKKQEDKDVEFNLGANPKPLEALDKRFRDFVAIKNDFHRVDCIAAKMDALEWALKEAGNTFFLDADIVAVSNLNDGFENELMLSPHYHGGGDMVAAGKFGIFNAGYLWTNNAAVPEAWREIYLKRSKFFEQEGMALFAEQFDVGSFSEFHNVGFWREPFFPKGGVRSWHVHITDCLDDKANAGLRGKYVEHRARVRQELQLQGRADLLAHIKGMKN